MFRELRKEVLKSLRKFDIEEKLLKESEHADITCTAAFKLAKERNKSPAEVAEDIISKLELENFDYIGSVEAVDGYINFFASYDFLEDTINLVLDEEEDYGSLSLGGEVLIEHTSANPDGPLHIGHLRNLIIGDTLTRIFRKAGISVKTHYYINDMGRQTALAVLGLQKFGFDSSKKPDHAIAEAYIAINRHLQDHPELENEVEELMIKYEFGDVEVDRLFKDTVEKALNGVKKTLERLNVQHDEYVWESEFIRNGYVGRILEMLDGKGLIEKNGAWIIDLSEIGHEKEVVLRRENGTSLYVTRDLAYHLWKNENFERLIDVLGADHKLIGRQLSDILKLINLKPPEIVFFEFVSLPEGSMSTREGKFISADELIERIYQEAYEIIKNRGFSEEEKDEIAWNVAIGALRYDFVRVAPEKPMTFDWKKALDFERQTASYIQYSHTRACSILRKAVEEDMPELEFVGEFCTPMERKLVILLSKFSSIVERVVSELRPNVFADYVMDVALSFNDFYRDHPVLRADAEHRMHRLAIVDATRIVLRNGLELLGITPLERM
jgi:arginyl-tRNA synthetase